MPDVDFTTALARLLRDKTLRRDFISDPRAVANALNVRSEDCAAFVRIPCGDLECQARTLLHKRFHAVQKLAPITCRRLGSKAWSRFEAYAETHWPEGHHRHLIDALAFCEWICTPAKSEQKRLQFALGKQRFAFHWNTDSPLAFRILKRLRDGFIREHVLSFDL